MQVKPLIDFCAAVHGAENRYVSPQFKEKKRKCKKSLIFFSYCGTIEKNTKKTMKKRVEQPENFSELGVV